MKNARQHLGLAGEQCAATFLESLGYRILERNFRCRLGELDLIALWAEYIIFCEVKTRSTSKIHPTASITFQKQQKLRDLALFYLAEHRLESLQPRFDVIAVQWRSKQTPVIEHFINAF